MTDASIDTTISIHPDTRLGAVSLTVADLGRSIDFYERVIGLQVHKREGADARLGVGGPDLLHLYELPGAEKASGTAGLYHYALLLPERRDMAWALRRISDARVPVQGLVDHWISEAAYLPDPDGHGIEIAVDRPREKWPELQKLAVMGNGPMDVDGVFEAAEGAADPQAAAPGSTVIGHVHLHVGDLVQAEGFYTGLMGFDRMMRFGPQASFVSAGGYHHHIGLNTWAGQGVGAPPNGSLKLEWFEVLVPHREELDRLLTRFQAVELDIREVDGGYMIRDPWEIGVVLRLADHDE